MDNLSSNTLNIIVTNVESKEYNTDARSEKKKQTIMKRNVLINQLEDN